ncbi:amino acid ABC transporter substrate-binding protein (PAAT family) [Ancylobacter aquaticus]|uniref:Amino acid ABC transporter substrate-binding protein (PAAT family) n=1 Tax=Ancylobacter aquaticus TaxID=100 RepID=A0A4R1HCA3_ANCAQ|nr:transporter substrate-binding domain-containing protein [Ancylobacter aquaticus]TCK19637.1 amino acid ABC transporter substrate-binding protein (PAAT family) [Ancylobacter aquaticus]
MKRLLFALGTTLLTLSAPVSASAQSLDAIIKSGKIRIATDIGLPPYGILNAKNEPDGIDIAVGKALAAGLGVTYEHVPVTGNNRIAYLQTNKVDLVISTFSITADRAKSVDFSIPYALQRSIVVAPAEVEVKTYDDLLKLRVGVARGTTHEKRVLSRAPEVKFIRFDDDAAAQAALMSGQVDAIGINDSAASTLAKRYPDRKFEIKLENAPSYLGIGVNRNNPDLLRWVNTWVFENRVNGRLDEIYKSYVGIDLPQLPSF